MAFGTDYTFVPSKVEQLSNQIFTHRLSLFSPFLMEGTKTNNKRAVEPHQEQEVWKRQQKYLFLSQFSGSPLDDQTGNHFNSQSIPLKSLG